MQNVWSAASIISHFFYFASEGIIPHTTRDTEIHKNRETIDIMLLVVDSNKV